MFKQPLFGEDSSPHRTSTILSAIITLCAWIVFCFMSFFIKFKPKTPEYKEIQIVLSSEKHEQNQESSSASAPAPMEAAAIAEEVIPEPAAAVAEPVEAPAKVEPVPAPKVETAKPKTTSTPSTSSETTKSTATAKSTPKQTTTPKATDPSKKVNFDDYQYATDYSDFDFNNVSTNKKQDFDWSQFDDAASEPQPQVSQQVKTVTTQSSVGGSAASTTTQSNQGATSSQSKTSSSTSQAVSSATSNALSNIRSTQYSASTGNSIKSITDAKTTKGSDGTLSMAMTDGSTRVLIDPIPPVIKLSEEAASLIDSTRTVTIEFQVLASGNVPRAQIKITPESILPQAVRTEIYDQLSKWLFESSSSAARATFEYTIKKQ
ncbi:MAG: hypothetical protein IKR45_01885 [Treponema sp.]|nr:hypothetical protein [Treponema sp.]